MYSRTRTFGAEVQKSNIRVTKWHNKYKILNCIERHNFCLSDLLTKSNRTTLQSYKVEERTWTWSEHARENTEKFPFSVFINRWPY